MDQSLGDWLTTEEAASLAGYHPNHIRRLIKAGEISARKWGHDWMVSRSSLLKYLRQVEAEGGKRGPKPGKTDN